MEDHTNFSVQYYIKYRSNDDLRVKDALLAGILSSVLQPFGHFWLIAANYINYKSFPIFTLTLTIHRDRSLADLLSVPARRKLEKP